MSRSNKTSERRLELVVALDHKSTHHGEFGICRSVFAGLPEADDSEMGEVGRRLLGGKSDGD